LVLEDARLVGVLSERDVIRKCVCRNRHTAETSVSEIMTADPITIDADGTLARSLEIMGEGGFHHVPVLQHGKPVGLLSSDDVPEEYRMMLERFKKIRGG
jgi:CBS domain-containing protein